MARLANKVIENNRTMTRGVKMVFNGVIVNLMRKGMRSPPDFPPYLMLYMFVSVHILSRTAYSRLNHSVGQN